MAAESSDLSNPLDGTDYVDFGYVDLTGLAPHARRMQIILQEGQRYLQDEISKARNRMETVERMNFGCSREPSYTLIAVAHVTGFVFAMGQSVLISILFPTTEIQGHILCLVLLGLELGMPRCIARALLTYKLEAASARRLQWRLWVLLVMASTGTVQAFYSMTLIIIQSVPNDFSFLSGALYFLFALFALFYLSGCVGRYFGDLTILLGTILQVHLQGDISVKQKHCGIAQKIFTSTGVILFSAPFRKASDRIQELRAIYENDFDQVFIFDPDHDMETVARACLMDEQTQGVRWLQIWMDFFLLMKEKRDAGDTDRNKVVVMVPQIPRKEDSGQWDLLDIDKQLQGAAQHGEVRVAIAAGFVSESTGLFFETYVPK